ncbi:MAG: cytidylate kinase-like family protein [Lachnospiraceae bacterium]|nr:cytidylate kinase-like family protein [Lachnospiraceae bacterium]
MKIITINREFGSGGRELGKKLAEELGFAYYDKEIIDAIAEKSKLDPNYINKAIEDGMWRNYPVTFNNTFAYMPVIETPGTRLISWQSEVLHEIAAKSDCVIVGRAADAILDELHPLKLFIYADMEAKVIRCQERAEEGENLTDREMVRHIKKIDRSRASNHDLVASYRWGDRNGFDLCVNTTSVEIDSVIKPLAEYARAWFK